MKFVVFLCSACFFVGIHKSQAALGGGTCTIPAVGSGPGASTVCTAAANGFCLLDHISATGTPSITSVTYDGVCVCYYGYTGTNCASVDTSVTGTSTNGFSNAVGAIAVGGIGAYILSQLASGQTAQGIGSGMLTT